MLGLKRLWHAHSHSFLSDLHRWPGFHNGVILCMTHLPVGAGLFVSLEGFQRHGLVHHSSVSEEVAFDQGDDDADRITALEYFFPVGTKVTKMAHSIPLQRLQWRSGDLLYWVYEPDLCMT